MSPTPSIRAMIQDQTVISITPDDSVHQAAVLMATHRIGAVAVMQEAGLIGIMTERDLVNRVFLPRLDPDRTTVRQVMTENPKTISPDRTPCDALNLMYDHGFRHLPVVDEGRVIAVLSLRDIPTKYRFMREKWIEMRQSATAPAV